jgi:hypothetical protein
MIRNEYLLGTSSVSFDHLFSPYKSNKKMKNIGRETWKLDSLYSLTD